LRCGKATTFSAYAEKPAARAKAAEVVRLNAEGLQRTAIARRLEFGVASVYRVIADAKIVESSREVAT
jgi:DNA invertase Pin-like site-specific DNA recombinase